MFFLKWLFAIAVTCFSFSLSHTSIQANDKPPGTVVKAIIFDCDGTLIDVGNGYFLDWQHALRCQGYELNEEAFWEFMHRNHLVGLPEADSIIVKYCCDLLGRDCADELLKDKAAFSATLHQSYAFPPIESTVQFLRELGQEKTNLGLKLGLASGNTRQSVLRVLKRLEVDHYFDAVVASDDLTDYDDPEGTNKPKPYIYLHASKLLGLPPEQCVAIEDSLTGLNSAKSAGCIAVAIPNAHTNHHDLSHAHLKLVSFAGITPSDFLRRIRAAHAFWERSPLEVRETINQLIMAIDAPTFSVWATEDHVVTHAGRSTPIRVYLPNDAEHLPVILLIHGGARVAGNLETHDNLARFLCSQTAAIVVSVGYTNAPEGKFPLPLEQSLDALMWVINTPHAFSADPSRLAIVGDSSGGNLAAALCLMLRDKKGPAVSLQVLINPAPDLRCNGTLQRQNDCLDSLRWQASHYLSCAQEADHPYVSPLNAQDLKDLPLTWIFTCEHDALRLDGERFAKRLRESGVQTFVYCQKGIGHLAGHGARASPHAYETLERAVLALKEAFFNTASTTLCPGLTLPAQDLCER